MLHQIDGPAHLFLLAIYGAPRLADGAPPGADPIALGWSAAGRDRVRSVSRAPAIAAVARN